MLSAGILSGYPDGSFKPSNPITRAEFVAIIAKLSNPSVAIRSQLSDISGHWAEDYIKAAVGRGCIHGYPDLTFKPDQYITRAEAISIVNRMLGRGVTSEHMHEDMRVWSDNSNETAWYYNDIQEASSSHSYIRTMHNSERWIAVLNEKKKDEQ